MYPVKDSAERGVVFSKHRFLDFLGIPNKSNWSITVSILLYCTLRCHCIVRTVKMETEFKYIQSFVPHLRYLRSIYGCF